MKISIKAIDNPLNSMLFIITIVVVGIISLRLLPLELFPEVEPPIIFVTVIYHGASPTEIEFQVNKKIETEVKNLDDIKKIQSIATVGVGTTIIEFTSGSDSDEKKREVRDAVNQMEHDLPDDIEAPIVKSLGFTNIPVMNILLYAKEMDYVKLKDIAKIVKEKFETVSDVSTVNIFGGLDREISISVDPISLWANKVVLRDVINFFNKGNLNTPGGKVSIDKRDYYIRVLAKFIDAGDVNKVVLAYRNGKPLYLKDLGTIKAGTAEVDSFARFNGYPSISLAINKQSGSNLIDISDKIYKMIDQVKKSKLLPKGVGIAVVGDQADEVKIRVNELTTNAVQGIIIVFILLALTMGIRNALIASMGIPFAIVFTMVGFLIFDETINNISQFGLILIVGIVVDGAIVVLENSYRHLELGENPISSSKIAIEEVGSAVISSGLTTMAAFAPMLFMTGIVGRFMGVIPKTVIIAIFGSLVFDHIVIPVLCSKFIRVGDQRKDSIFVKLLKKTRWKNKVENIHPFKVIFAGYKKIFLWSINNRFKVLIIAGVAFISGITILRSIPGEFFPEMDFGKVYIDIELPRGSTVKSTDRIAKQIEAFVNKHLRTKDNQNGPVEMYSSSIGSIGASTMGNVSSSAGPHIAKITIDMVDVSERGIGVNEFISNLRHTILTNSVGAKFRVTKPKGGPPTGDPINAVIFGDDVRVLKRLSKRVQSIAKNVPGTIEIIDNYGVGRPEIQMPINRVKAERYGISVQEIQNLIFVLYNGFDVAKYQFGQDEYEIRLKLSDDYKKNIGDLKKLTIYSNRLRKSIPISELVDIKLNEGLSVIRREDLKRAITIGGEVDRSRYTTSDVAKEFMTSISDLSLPPGYSIRFRGENEDRDESFEGLKMAFVVGVMLIYFIVVMQLRSFLQPISIMVSVILSVFGIALGLVVSGSNLGVMAMFGAVALTGIVVNGAIVLVTYINLLRDKGKDVREAVIEASETRLRPILLTTFSTIGGLLPLALALGGARDFWTPLGWSIIGGLLIATFQTLIVVPVVYSLLEDLKAKYTLKKHKELNRTKDFL